METASPKEKGCVVEKAPTARELPHSEDQDITWLLTLTTGLTEKCEIEFKFKGDSNKEEQ